MADIEITNQYASKQDIYSWFETDDFPTEAQFRATWDSYWHKSENIPMASISGLVAKFNQTVSKSTFESHLIDEDAHVTTLAKIDASNIGPNQGAWRTALGIGDITPPDVDLSNYYTKPEVDDLLENITVDLTGYATESWVTTQTAPATQAEVEASTGTESQPLSAEPATENRKFLSLFNFFKLIKKLRYIHLLPNSATAVANRLRSDGSRLHYANNSAIESTVAYTSDLYENNIVAKVLKQTDVNGTFTCDLKSYSKYNLTLNGTTTIAFSNLPGALESTTGGMTVTGGTTLIFPSWLRLTPSSDTYDGTKINRIVYEIDEGGPTPSGWYNIIRFEP